MKVDIISGFLGAGKTTLIKKLLDTLVKDEKVAIVENEYGEVGIDGDLLKDRRIEVIDSKGVTHIFDYKTSPK